MKKFDTYINEKLKLDDISKLIKWVDAKSVSYDNLQEGCVVQLKNGMRFVVVSQELASQCMDFLTVYKSDEYILFRKKGLFNAEYGYMRLVHYKDKFPKYKYNDHEWDIEKVYLRKKNFANKLELENYLLKIEVL